MSLLRLRTSESGAGLNKKKSYMGKKKRTLVLTAECEYPDGKPAHFFVYYTSGGFEIIGPDRQRHRCHLSVKNAEQAQIEIAKAYGVTVKLIILP